VDLPEDAAVLPLLLALSLGAPSDDRIRDDADLSFFIEKSLQGTWKVEKSVENDKPLRYFQGARFTFKDGKLTVKFSNPALAKVELLSTLKEGKTPREIDFIGTDDHGKQVTPGIYELTGGTLRLCFAEDELKKRPTQFKSVERGITYLELKRYKP
jgi:uncharacterized protein (TIGR03067 family)